MAKHFLNGTVALSLALSACSLAPNYQQPDMALPSGWSSVAGVGVNPQASTEPFWEALGSADLDRLVEIALAQNLDLEAALHRIDQARAQAKVAASPLYPTVNASGSASRTFQDPKDTTAVHGSASINYEVDLWGKNRNNAKSADYRTQATIFDREALRLVITADVTNFYTQILSLNDRIHIAEFNLKNAEEILRIVEARFAQGSVSGLEVSQQRVAVNNFRTALASLIEQRATTGNALAILLGRAPQNFPTPKLELASVTLPQVNLTPPATILLAPIFTGGKLTGNLENVTARQKELAAQYQKTVLTAFQEVEDALAGLKSANDRVVIARDSVVESQNAYDIAKARFDAGAIDYLNLLDTQRSLYLQQDNQITTNQDQLRSFVQLRKALGS
jgi:outer membrane protein, multidrug efflux system